MIRSLTVAAATLVLSIAPSANAHPGREVERLTFETHADVFNSDRLLVRVEGAGRDIILIPGLSSSPEIWDTTVAYLGPDWRAHRIHIKGFAGVAAEGNAEGPIIGPVADEIARYIREAGLDQPVVVGHSMGGTIGLQLAADHPDLIGRLVVVDMLPFMGAAFGATPERAVLIADQMHAAMNALSDDDYRAQGQANVAGMIATENQRAGPIAHTLASDRRVSANAFRELVVTDLRPRLSAISAPTKVLYIKFNDPRMTEEITDGIYRAAYGPLPGVDLHRIDGAAHFIMFDQPETFFAELDRFIDGR